ncbi:AAEL007935-PF, partial [Aedes aegypti]
MIDLPLATKSEISQSYHRVSFIVKCCGLYPLVTDPEKRHRFCYQILNTVTILAAILGYGYILVHYSLASEFIRHNTGSVIIQRMVDIFHVTRYAMAAVVPVYALLSLDKIHQMLRGLEEVNVLIMNSGDKLIRSKLSLLDRYVRTIQLVALVVPLSCVVVSCAAFSHIPVGLGFRISRLLCFFSYAQLWTQPTLIVLQAGGRFTSLKLILRMYFPTTPSCGGFLSSTSHTETVICNEKEQLAVLKQIKILHDKLNDVVELVNYCFSVQITFCVGLCFVIGVVCSFGLFRAFIYRNELFYMGVLNFVWYMYYLFFVLFFIAVGSKITREGKRIGVLVHKAINCASSSAVINELNIFSQQLLHRSPVITCGLFVYDWTLLYTMIGATATYLIILIQFDVSFPNLVNVNGTQTAASGV